MRTCLTLVMAALAFGPTLNPLCEAACAVLSAEAEHCADPDVDQRTFANPGHGHPCAHESFDIALRRPQPDLTRRGVTHTLACGLGGITRFTPNAQSCRSAPSLQGDSSRLRTCALTTLRI